LDAPVLSLHAVVARAPLLDLGLVDLTELVDSRHVAGKRALGNIGHPAKEVLGGDAVRDRHRLDPDDADPGVVGAAVVLSVAEVTQPGLERRAVVLLDQATICDNLSDAADRRPLARAVEERDVDVRVLGQLVRLVRLGVGVEEQVNATVLLPPC
jgi:hypothetical protein